MKLNTEQFTADLEPRPKLGRVDQILTELDEEEAAVLRSVLENPDIPIKKITDALGKQGITSSHRPITEWREAHGIA